MHINKYLKNNQVINKLYIKPFVFDFINSYELAGADYLSNINVIIFKFKNKLSYFYTSEHGLIYSGFDTFWKFQHKYDDSKIWQQIRQLDSKKYICFNDIHDKCESKYSNMIDSFEVEDFDFPYQNILEYAQEKYSNDKYLIIKFCHLFQEIMNNEFNLDLNLRENNLFFILQCISDFYLYQNSFYEHEINISIENWSKLEKIIGNTKSMVTRNHNLLFEKLPSKNKDKETKTKI